MIDQRLRRSSLSALLPCLLAAGCSGPSTEEPAAATAPLEVSFQEESAATTLALRLTSCSGVLGPYSGRATASGFVAGASDVSFRLQTDAKTTLDLLVPLDEGAMKGTMRGRLQVTPATYENPVAGMAPVHQLRFTGGFTFETAAGAMSLPPVDLYITARPVAGPCGR